MNKNFDFLKDINKISTAKSIEEIYWRLYYGCDDWSTDDIVFDLKITFQVGESVLTDDEFDKVIEIIESI